MSFKKDIDMLIAEKKIIEKDIQEEERELEKCKEERYAAEDARIIYQLAAKKTQQRVEHHFSDLVTKAFHLIFDDPYTFIPKFEERRNKTECDLFFEKGGKLMRPRFSAGGGTIDIASFASRLAYWKIEKSAPVFVLDEPFKMLSKKHIPRAIEMLRLLSQEFNLQLIINTHIPEIAEHADKVFEIKKGEVVTDDAHNRLSHNRYVEHNKRVRS